MFQVDMQRARFLKILCLVLIIVGSEKVKAQFVVQPKIFSPRDLYGPWAGVRQVIVGDFNNDGFDDVYVIINPILGGPYPGRLLKNDGSGNFEDVTDSAKIVTSHTGFSAAWGDYNQDEFLDSIVITDVSSYLFKNNGDGTFTDVANEVGIDTLSCRRFFPCSLSWLDYDRDAYPDILFWESPKPPRLFHNLNGEKFVDVTVPLELTSFVATGDGFSLGDFDNDRDLDLATSTFLLQQKSNGTFERLDFEQGIGGRSAWADLDHDGLLDILNGPFLLKNLGNSNFNDISDHMQSVGNNGVLDWIDYNNDGHLDIFELIGVTDVWPIFALHENLGNSFFINVSDSSGLNLEPSGGAEWLDVDRDGNLDLLFSNGRFGLEYFKNVSSNNSLTIKLKGTVSGTDTFGARALLYGTSSESQIVLLRDVPGTKSSGGQNSPNLHFGLNNITGIDSLVIMWPTGIRQTVNSPQFFSTILEKRFEHDIFVQHFTKPINLESVIHPEVVIRNIGTNTESNFPVTLTIRKNEDLVYEDNVVITSLTPNVQDTVRFREWSPELGGLVLTAVARNELDQNSNNDTLRLFLNNMIVSVRENGALPYTFKLLPSYPNPFNSTTNISYSLGKSEKVELTVYNLLGKLVARLVNDYQKAGNYSVLFSAKNLASGIYVYELKAGNFHASCKLFYIK